MPGKTACYIIAEAGVNHNGDLAKAYELVDAAVASGADAVKFQTFKADKLVTKAAGKAEYQKGQTSAEETQFAMLKKLELSESDHDQIFEYCKTKRIQFLSTAFDLDSLDFIDRYEMPYIKISSGELTNYPFLKAVAKKGKTVIMSTGMANLSEIEMAIGVLEEKLPRNQIIVLHCNTQYPTLMEDVNLQAMITIKNAFPGIRIGYSDHTLGIEVPIASAALGAEVLEKHFTIDKTMEGPDHAASLDPEELTRMVCGVRNIVTAMGHGRKEPSPSEIENKGVARKSIRAAREILEGELITEEMLTVKRPADGRSPMDWNLVVGTHAIRHYQIDEAI